MTISQEYIPPTSLESLPIVVDLEFLAFSANQGVPKSFLIDISEKLSVSVRSLAPLLHISERQLSRYEADQILPPDLSERALQIGRVYGRAVAVFGDEEKAVSWLKRPNRVLGSSPLDVLVTAFGVERVLQILSRLEHGVYS